MGSDDLAAVIMSACRTDMVWTLQLPAIGAFGMGIRAELMMLAAHIALRRRGFSLWNRHGGNPFLNKIARFCRRGDVPKGNYSPKRENRGRR